MRKLCLWGGVIASALLIGCKDAVDESVFLVDASQAVEADLTDVATDFRIIRLKSDAPLDTRMQYFFFDKWVLSINCLSLLLICFWTKLANYYRLQNKGVNATAMVIGM